MLHDKVLSPVSMSEATSLFLGLRMVYKELGSCEQMLCEGQSQHWLPLQLRQDKQQSYALPKNDALEGFKTVCSVPREQTKHKKVERNCV